MASLSVLVVGLGRFGTAVAEAMMALGHEVCGVDTERPLVDKLKDRLTLCLQADLSDPDAVAQVVGHGNFDVAVVAIGTDLESSLLVSLNLRKAGIPRVISKAIDATHGELLQAIGVHRVVYPEREAGERLAMEIGIRGLTQVVPLGHGLELVEVQAPSAFHGKSLKELDLRARHGVTVAAIRRGTETIQYPGPDARIGSGDVLMMLGRPEHLQNLLHP